MIPLFHRPSIRVPRSAPSADAVHQARVLSWSPLAFLRMNGNTNDTSVNGRNFTALNTPSYGDGALTGSTNQSMVLDGTNARGASIAYASWQDGLKAVWMFVKFAAVGSFLFAIDDENTNRKFRIEIRSGNIGGYLWNQAGAFKSIAGSLAPTQGQWHLVGAQVEADGNARYYLDDQVSGTATGTTGLCTSCQTTAFVGRFSNAAYGCVNGSIDEVILMDRPLTSTEIGQLLAAIA